MARSLFLSTTEVTYLTLVLTRLRFMTVDEYFVIVFHAETNIYITHNFQLQFPFSEHNKTWIVINLMLNV